MNARITTRDTKLKKRDWLSFSDAFHFLFLSKTATTLIHYVISYQLSLKYIRYNFCLYIPYMYNIIIIIIIIIVILMLNNHNRYDNCIFAFFSTRTEKKSQQQKTKRNLYFPPALFSPVHISSYIVIYYFFASFLPFLFFSFLYI